MKRFLSLEWKQFFRSASFGKNIALKVLMGFFAVYIIGFLLVFGFLLYPGLKKAFPGQDPFIVVNGFVFFWFVGDLLVRFFFQKLPVMSVKPLLTLPIKRRAIVHYVLVKSAISFFNFLPLFAFVPFGIVLLTKNYNPFLVSLWVLTLLLITLISNFLNFIIENFSAERELSFLPIIALAGVLFGLNHFELVHFSELVSKGVIAVSNNGVLLILPLLILVLLYALNYKLLYKKLYLDHSLQTKTQEVKTSDLTWTKHFGESAPFMQLDLKLIWRNKRPRATVFMLVFGLLYGLYFYTSSTFEIESFFIILIGILVTGFFIINFGQFIPAWDGSYYKMLMSQNIKYEQYLKSKQTLMVLSVIVMFILSIPYVYFGWKILLLHFGAAIYNIGVNSYVIMFAGSFNRKKIDLNQRAAFNYQGMGAVQWLIGIPLMILPIVIYSIFYYAINFEAGMIAIGSCGVVGIIFHQKLIRIITKKYLSSKYKMIDAFSQDH